jgi:2-C-methyl-D-erythritol 2,4-cyclodiphosphate synthase
MPRPPVPRVGLGYDVHAFAAGRRLVLGGVEIPAEVGLLGHSDADVLTHAVMDALLGALALGDIGHHFPPSDPRWRDADSLDLLRRVVALIAARGWRVGNVDTTVVLERPRLAPHIDAMRARLAEALHVATDEVGVKATTSERLGFVGRREGAVAHAVALLVPIEAGG